MTPVTFPQVNCVFGPPVEIDESQVQSIKAFKGHVDNGSLDGADVVVTAWKPSDDELAALNAGSPVFLSFIGDLPPHLATTSFDEAIRIA